LRSAMSSRLKTETAAGVCVKVSGRFFAVMTTDLKAVGAAADASFAASFAAVGAAVGVGLCSVGAAVCAQPIGKKQARITAAAMALIVRVRCERLPWFGTPSATCIIVDP